MTALLAVLYLAGVAVGAAVWCLVALSAAWAVLRRETWPTAAGAVRMAKGAALVPVWPLVAAWAVCGLFSAPRNLPLLLDMTER